MHVFEQLSNQEVFEVRVLSFFYPTSRCCNAWSSCFRL